jgi:CelD/BcsL family acetyltransferase involved in cellulose biosynthesis
MRVTVVQPGELGASEAGLWAQFQKISPAMSSPFLSLTFAQTVARVRSTARVAVIEEGGKIEAFLPFEMRSTRIAMPIGWPLNDLQGFISSSAPIDARSVVKAAGLRGWRFDNAPAEQEALATFHYYQPAIQCPVIDLTDGYETYFQSRSSSFRAVNRRRRRNLEREFGPVSVELNSSNSDYLRQLLDWKSDRYVGAHKIFADPANRQILAELFCTGSEECGSTVSVLLAGDRVVAISLDLQGKKSLHSWLASFDQELSRFGPGNLLLLAISEAAAARQIYTIDLGYGQHDYKFKLANSSYPVAGGAVWASRTEEISRKIYRRLVQRNRRPA